MKARLFYTKKHKYNQKVIPVDLPYVPAQIDLADLQLDSGKLRLLSAAQRKELAALDKGERMSKRETALPYTVYKHAGQDWVVYKGVSQKKALGTGQYGAVKLVEKDGVFYALKLQTRDLAAAKNEFEKLQALKAEQLGLAVTSDELAVRNTKHKFTQTQIRDHSKAVNQLKAKADQIDMQLQASVEEHAALLEKQAEIWEVLKHLPPQPNTNSGSESKFRHYEETKQVYDSIDSAVNQLEIDMEDLEAELDEVHQDLEVAETVLNQIEQTLNGDQIEETPKQYAMFMELVPGKTLEESLDLETQGLKQAPMIRLRLALQMLKALQRINEKAWAHIDIKPANIILNIENLSAQFVDFGFAGKMDKDGQYLTTLKGDPKILPPELRRELIKHLEADDYHPRVAYSEATEVYAMGIMLAMYFNLYEMPQTQLADWVDQSNLVAKITDQHQRCGLPMDVMEAIHKVLTQMTLPDPNERIGFQDAERELNTIYQAYLTSYQPQLFIKVIDMNDYLMQGGNARELDLEGCDEVWLIDTGEHDLLSYLKVKRELEAQSYTVGDKVFVGDNTQAALLALNKYISHELGLPCKLEETTPTQKTYQTPGY